VKAYGGVDTEIHFFLISALVAGEWSASSPGRFSSGDRAPSNHWIGDLVGPRAGLNDMEQPQPPVDKATFAR
jgi:hypothetical protein